MASHISSATRLQPIKITNVSSDLGLIFEYSAFSKKGGFILGGSI
jgi:hypothetical protein